MTKSSSPRSARADVVDPVAGGEQLGGPRRRVAPAGRVVAGAVEGDGEVQRAAVWCRRRGHQAAAVNWAPPVGRLVHEASALNEVKSVVSRKAGIEYRSRA